MRFENISLSHCLLTILFVVSVYPECFGQNNQGTSAVNPPPAAMDLELVVRDEKIDLRFEEPTPLSEVIDHIRSKKSGINIVVPQRLNSVMVAPLELENVSIQAGLYALSPATGGQIEWDFDGTEEAIYIAQNPDFAVVKPKVYVIDVKHILAKGENAEASMLSAVEIGMNMNETSPSDVTLKLHKETKLLFVRAGYNESELVYEILEQLGGEKLRPSEFGGGGFGGGGGAFGGDGPGSKGGGAGGGGGGVF